MLLVLITELEVPVVEVALGAYFQSAVYKSLDRASGFYRLGMCRSVLSLPMPYGHYLLLSSAWPAWLHSSAAIESSAGLEPCLTCNAREPAIE